ncbi:hypothetical protein OH77DRAFT_630988 [Trametes cingulata]|nr:hypothetical protein OH77DRAFT_630988 [Trametes cingulata]
MIEEDSLGRLRHTGFCHLPPANADVHYMIPPAYYANSLGPTLSSVTDHDQTLMLTTHCLRPPPQSLSRSSITSLRPHEYLAYRRRDRRPRPQRDTELPRSSFANSHRTPRRNRTTGERSTTCLITESNKPTILRSPSSVSAGPGATRRNAISSKPL